MRPLADFAQQELLWVQPAAMKREHELRAGDEVVANLRFERGSLASAVAAEGEWTFKRQGFWQPRVTARAAGSPSDIALFRPHWAGGGRLELADGTALQLSSANFWQSQWVWQQQDRVLLRYKGRHGLIKAGGALELAPEAAHRPDIALLALLGWYLILLHAEDSTASTAAAITPVISST
jgi:hypothetical protein